MPYNPFDKPIGDALTPNDLQVLIQHSVAEGYYVEYKRELPTAKEKIGKSIAALANTYGGWYIVGVQTDQHNVANNICGFSLTTYPDPISTVRDVIKSRVNPVPVFYPQVVTLGSNTVVLLVYVPEEQDTPFITKDGRIYRRVADSSDPVYEKDRYTIDQLYEHGRKNVQRFERFCSDRRSFAQSESGGWINIFLSPYPYGLINKLNLLFSIENLENVLQRSQESLDISLKGLDSFRISGNVPFNSGQLTHRSVILRQVLPIQVAFNSLTVELFIDGSAKFFIPLPGAIDVSEDKITVNVQSRIVRAELQKYIAEDRASQSLHHLSFFNIGLLCATLVLLLNFYFDWLGDISLLTAFRSAIVLSNVWRTVPFADADEWGKHVQKFGVPVMPANTVKIPEEIGHGILLDLDEDASPIWVSILNYMNQAFGLPHELSTHFLVNALLKYQTASMGE